MSYAPFCPSSWFAIFSLYSLAQVHNHGCIPEYVRVSGCLSEFAELDNPGTVFEIYGIVQFTFKPEAENCE